MGLDMYAFSVAKNDGNEDFVIAEDNEHTEIAYWRKHMTYMVGWNVSIETRVVMPSRLTASLYG